LRQTIFLLVLLVAAVALADKIVLKDGRVFEGKITGATATGVTIKLKLGEATFKRDQIASIEYGEVQKPDPVPEETGQRPYPQPKDEKQILVLINKYLREKDQSARKRLADALQPTLESEPELVERAAAGFREYRPRRKGHSSGKLDVCGVKTDYALYVPEKYDPKKSWPLLVALHGRSGRGRDYIKFWHYPVRSGVKPGNIDKFQQAQKHGYIVVAPTATEKWKWGPGKEAAEQVFALVERVRDQYHVDPNRVYLHGLSMGGYGAWHFGLHYADRFAAIEPRAAGYDQRFLVNAKNLPVRITHGAKDEKVPVKHSRDAAAKLKELKYDYEYGEVLEGEHTFLVDENGKVLDFFDKRKRVPCPRDVVWLADSPAHGRAYWLEITKFESPGLAKIEGSYDPKTNTIELKTKNVAEMTIYLNRNMVDFAKLVVVKVNGEEKHKAAVKPSAAVFLEILRATRDEARLFSMKLRLKLDR
jgi:predicted esterase